LRDFLRDHQAEITIFLLTAAGQLCLDFSAQRSVFKSEQPL